MDSQTRALRTPNIVFLVMAAAAPLTVVSAGVATGYATSGMPGMPLGYIVAGAMVAVFAIGFIAMAKEIPNTAAFFSYVSAGMGASHGLAASWLAIISYLCMQIALFSLLGYTAQTLTMETFGINFPWWTFTIIALTLVGLLGVKSADVASKVLGVLIFCEIIAISVFCYLALSNPAHGTDLSTLSPDSFLGAGTGTVLAFTIAGFMGIESTTIYSEEAENPHKTIPQATQSVIAIISILYAFSSWAMAQTVGSSNIVTVSRTEGSGLYFNFLAAQGLSPVVPFIKFLLVTSLFAAVVSFHNSISRYLMALGREEVLWAPLGKVLPNGAPATASILLTIFGFFTVLFSAAIQNLAGMSEDFPATIIFSWMSNAGGFGLVFLFLITSFSVINYFAHRNHNHGKLSTVFAPSISVLTFGFVLVIILYNFKNLVGDPKLWFLGFILPAVIFACGIAGFARGEFLRKNRLHVYNNIGSGKAP
ncbi:APC family permease (plasmid) [Corynebacterium diphtheriae]|nr:APC family permease [Corynebacterium belfantii]QVI98664.1 APC family permease [Corynebacterium diphtheriae]QVJ00031.1 APC family permease [Corynebacterium diphtheriae]